jgi:signal transduction histidine kinase
MHEMISLLTLKRLGRNDLIVIILFAIVVGFGVFFFNEADTWVGRKFPGFLTFENQVVGAFNQFEWEGVQEGLKYHDYIVSNLGPHHYNVVQDGQVNRLRILPQYFKLEDFRKTFIVPFFSGICFVIFALIIYWVMRGQIGAFPFFLFNLAVGYYLMASFNVQSDYHLSWFFLLNFSLQPAYMTHFALIFPEKSSAVQRNRMLLIIPYAISILLFLPYLITFYKYPLSWPNWEMAVVCYCILSYIFWLIHLGHVARSPKHETSRIIAKYLLAGQVLAFVVPLFLMLYIFIFRQNLPMNWAAPIAVIFPASALVGMTLAKLKRTQMDLIQSEKMASLGQLLAGVAHEINNPTTFIYSNIQPLKEYLDYLKTHLNHQAPKFKNEMTTDEVMADLEGLVENIEEGAERTRQIISDLRRFGHSQENVVSRVNLLGGIRSTLNILKHTWSDRIRMIVDCSPDIVLQTNSGQLSQLLMNLINNAIQAIEGEGRIWIQGYKDSSEVHISVRDTGCGIPKAQMNKIFDPFYTTKQQGVGTGLGLSIVQQIAKKLKATISVSSEPGKGTEFKINIKGLSS